MLVSLAVISLALAIVGIVFAITVKTAGQSAAYSETHNWVRQFMQQIDEDLRYCVPSQSILVLVGRTQAAALTKSDLDAGKFYRVLIGNPQDPTLASYDPAYSAGVDAPNGNYSDPRADLLMFFSNRPTASVAPNPDAATDGDPTNDFYAAGVKLAPIRVVYGHAALADAVWGGTSYGYPAPNQLRHIDDVGGGATDPGQLSRLPANRWHLSRVATIVADPESVGLAQRLQFSDLACAQASRCQSYADLGQLLPGDAAFLSLTAFFGTLGPMSALYTPVPPLQRPYDELPAAMTGAVNALLYATGTFTPAPQYHHVATVLEDVPVELKSNLGVHMLPGCAWFQVEFLMPEDPRNSVEYSDPTPTLAGDYATRSDMPRWTTIPSGSTYVFVPDTPENRRAVALDLSGTGRIWSFARLDQTPANDASHPETVVTNRVIRLWPYAIRITVRVWDAQKRLDEPIVRSIVHRFE